ncbi:conserved hypothetical protein [Azospirillaceae bacterium]
MATKRYETCYTCRYWIGQGVRERGPKGSCRRYPPVVTNRHPEGVFPISLSTDWCGEWQRALPPGLDNNSLDVEKDHGDLLADMRL